nr:response regulator [uncultured Holophaga sp.]
MAAGGTRPGGIHGLTDDPDYLKLFRAAPTTMLLIHAESGRIVDANDAASHYYGFTRLEMAAMAITDLNTLPPVEVHQERMKAVQGQQNRFDFRHRLSSGETRRVEVHSTPIRHQGVEYLLSSVLDVTQLKEAEEEQHRLEAQLAVSQRMESLGRLTGGVAHDMNNVLAAILAISSLHLEEQPEGSRNRRAFEVITSAAQRGADLMRTLLRMARHDPAVSKPLDLNALLQEEAGILERTMPPGITLHLELHPGLCPVLGDWSALANAVMNVCINAIDAMGTHGILTLCTLEPGPGKSAILVSDTGHGMTEEVLRQAQSPFFTTKAPDKGTGLGLALVTSTVRSHQGKLEITSQPGSGTQVLLSFPSCLPAERSRTSGTPVDLGVRGLEVLQVDDDPLLHLSLAALAEALGHHLTSVERGEEALARVQSGLRPDVILLDMGMPGLGGAATLPELRRLLPGTPILLCTGRADDSARFLASSTPLTGILAKPFSLQEFQTALAPFEPRGKA